MGSNGGGGEIHRDVGWEPLSRLAPEMAPLPPATQLPYDGSDSLAFLVPYIGLDIDKVRYQAV